MAKGAVTDREKEVMNELYLKIGTYAGVAREVGRAASTVKRYILPNYVGKAERQGVDFSSAEWQAMLDYEVDFTDFMMDGASRQTEDEKKEMEELWEILAI